MLGFVSFCQLRSQCVKQLNSLSLCPKPNPLPGPLVAEARLSKVSFSPSLSHVPIPHPISYQVTCLLLLKHLSHLPLSIPTALYSTAPRPVTASGVDVLPPTRPIHNVLSPSVTWVGCQKMKLWHVLRYWNTLMSFHCSLNPVQSPWPCL